ncbi:hypothetical protein OJ998_27475 [Solirubrobacter taibaiensis]|nr:hypothetical protein [Solirubrobacter taibaiensis]
MKAWTLDAFDAAPGLRDDLPEPEGELIVAVKATSVNPVDMWVASGGMGAFAEHVFPVTLGRDFAGVTDAGEEVFGFIPPVWPNVHRGAWAERIAVTEGFIAPKPAALSMAEAGAAGLAGVTGLLAVEAIAPQPGERILVVGATGGVGAFVVQLCVAAGAKVIAPALEIDEAYLRGLGVEDVVAREERPDADAVIDLVAGAPYGPRFASPLPDDTGGYGVDASSDPGAVARLGAAIEEHGIRVPICEAFTFGQVELALEALGEHKQGKLSVA